MIPKKRTLLKIKIFVFFVISIISSASYAWEKEIIEIGENENYGLLLFYVSGCGKCDQQIFELGTFIKETGWKTYEMIDLNPAQLHSRFTIEELHKMTNNFHIETVPEMWLVSKYGDRVLIGYDFTPMETAKEIIKKAHFEWTRKR